MRENNAEHGAWSKPLEFLCHKGVVVDITVQCSHPDVEHHVEIIPVKIKTSDCIVTFLSLVSVLIRLCSTRTGV